MFFIIYLRAVRLDSRAQNPNAIIASLLSEEGMTPPISMIVAAVLGLALGYSGRRWWLSGIVTGTLLTLYGMSAGPEGIILVLVMLVIFFPLFFSIGGLASMIGQVFRHWIGSWSGAR